MSERECTDFGGGVAHGFWKRCAGAVAWLREFLKSGWWGWCWEVADCCWISGDVARKIFGRSAVWVGEVAFGGGGELGRADWSAADARTVLLIVADTAPQVAYFGHEAYLRAGFGRSRFREVIAHFVDLAFLNSFVDVGTKCVAFGVFQGP